MKDLEEWCNNGVTKEIVELIQERRNASSESLIGTVLNSYSLKDVDLCELSQYRGQIYALDLILDIEEFVRHKLEV
jgi:hypothetical protein